MTPGGSRGGSRIDALATVRCCGRPVEIASMAVAVSGDSPGAELGRAECGECGRAFTLGVIVESLPAAVEADAVDGDVADRESSGLSGSSRSSGGRPQRLTAGRYQPSPPAAESDVFEDVPPELLDAIGVDRMNFDGPSPDIALCFSCDGGVNRRRDWCAGCKEFVCPNCRPYLEITPRRHPAEKHTTKPKAKPAASNDAGPPLPDTGEFRAEGDRE